MYKKNLTVLFFLILIFWSSNSIAQTSGITNSEITFGQSAAFSGTSSALGSELWRGSEAYFKHINSQGGVQDGNNKMILLNLKDLEYLSSAGLRVILMAGKLTQSSRGKMKICEATGVVKEVMELSGFNSILHMYETEKDGVASFTS